MTVIDFCSAREVVKRTDTTDVSQIKDTVAARLYVITETLPRVHEERITERDVGAGEFFETFMERGEVTLIAASTDISYDSIMRVGDPHNGGSHDMLVKDFVRMTELRPGRTQPNEIHDYIMDLLANIGIKANITLDPYSSYTETDFLPDDIGTFLPESITIAWMNGDEQADCYDCMIETHDGIGIVVLPSAFADVLKTPLLHMLIHMREEYIINGYDMDEKRNIELCLREGEYIDTTNIPLSFLDTIIVNAIKRSNPLYSVRNISEEELIRTYYQKKVIPTLREVHEEEWE